MKNVKFVILTLVAVFLSVTHLYAFHSPNAIDNKLYTKDTLVLEPLASDNAYQEAKLWFLPDYQESISSDKRINEDKDKKPNTPNNCNTFNNDGSGRTYIEHPDFNLYNCSGPQSMANRVKCYYGCVCKPAVRFDSVSETCAYFCNGTCVGGVSCKPAVYPGTGEHCTLSCAGNSGICIIKACNTQVYPGVGEQCNQYCASNSSICTSKACKAAVVANGNWECTEKCAMDKSVCTARKCPISENSCSGYNDTETKSGTGWSYTECTKFSASSCSYGTKMYKNTCTAKYSLATCPTNGNCSQDCAGKYSFDSCKSGYHKNATGTGCDANCSVVTCDNSYTTTATVSDAEKSIGYYLSSCTPRGSSCDTGTTVYRKDCSAKYSLATCPTNGNCSKDCAGKYSFDSCVAGYSMNSAKTGCDKNCTPKAAATGCDYGTQDCDDGCGGTTTCCKGCTPKAAATGCSYGEETCNDGCGGTTTCCKACALPICTSISTKPDNSSYITASCTDCSGTKNVNTGWECNSGYSKVGEACQLARKEYFKITMNVHFDITYSDYSSSEFNDFFNNINLKSEQPVQMSINNSTGSVKYVNLYDQSLTGSILKPNGQCYPSYCSWNFEINNGDYIVTNTFSTNIFRFCGYPRLTDNKGNDLTQAEDMTVYPTDDMSYTFTYTCNGKNYH